MCRIYLISEDGFQILWFLGQNEPGAKDIHLGSMTGDVENVGDPFSESMTFQLPKNRQKCPCAYTRLIFDSALLGRMYCRGDFVYLILHLAGHAWRIRSFAFRGNVYEKKKEGDSYCN